MKQQPSWTTAPALEELEEDWGLKKIKDGGVKNGIGIKSQVT